MKDIIFIIVALGILAIGQGFVLTRALDAPIIYEDVKGKVCGCRTPAYQEVNKEACKDINRNEMHEVITVDDCKGGK